MRLYARVSAMRHAFASCPVWAAIVRHISSLMVSQSPASTLLTVAALTPFILLAALFWLPFCTQ